MSFGDWQVPARKNSFDLALARVRPAMQFLEKSELVEGSYNREAISTR